MESKKKYISKDDLEYILALSEGYEGCLRLSSGKLIYVKQPQKSPEEVGNAMHALYERMMAEKEKDNKNID